MDSSTPVVPPQPVSGRHRLHRWGLRFAIALGVFAVLWSAAWFYAPPLIAAQAEKAVSEALGRRLTLGKIEFNPWTLELTVNDLALAGPEAAAPPLLEIKRVYANAASVSLMRLAPVLDAFEIDAPTLRLAHNGDGRYDFDDILAKLAAAPKASAPSEPAKFSLHNIVLRAGAVEFTDLPLAAVHRVRDLEFAVPFISSLPSQREIKVEPHLAFALDGSRFDSAGSATPFAERGNGELHLTLSEFDVKPFLGYVPRGLPVELRAATLTADLAVAFEQRPKLSLNITGSVGADGVEVADSASQQLVQIGSVKVAIDEFRPLEQLARVKSIDVTAPHLFAVRDAKGRVNLQLADAAPPDSAAPVAKPPSGQTAASAASGTSASASASASASGGWRASVAAVSIKAGKIDWRDETTAPPATLALDDFSLSGQAIAWPLAEPVVFQGEGLLGTASDHGKLSFSGRGSDKGVDVQVTLADLSLAPLAPYLSDIVGPPLAGALSAELAINWEPSNAEPRLRVNAKRLALARATLGNVKSPELGAELVEIADARADTAAHTASIGRVLLRAPRVRIERDAAQRWGFEAWGRSTRTPTTMSATAPKVQARHAAASASSSTAPPWKLSLGELAVEQGGVSFSDRAGSPVALDGVDLAVQLRGWAFESAAAAPFHIAARVTGPVGGSGRATGTGGVGKVDVSGDLRGFAGGVPTGAQARLLVQEVPLHLLTPYLDEMLNVAVRKAQTSFKGTVRWEQRAAGPSLAVRGDLNVDDFRATTAAPEGGAPRRALAMQRDNDAAPTGRPLLNWKSLSLRGFDLAMAPGVATRLSVDETALSDFYARIVLDESGQLNLQGLTRVPTPSGAASAEGTAASAATASSAPVANTGPPLPASAPSTPAPLIKFGPIAVVNGRVDYNDRFVKPNYSANLSQLTGRLAAFSSEPPAPGQPPQLADLAVTGRVEGTATLDISGKVNPLAKPLALDLNAKVRELELPPLSPYAIKYAGYGIERGKMSVDLAYLVLPDGKLTASNKIVLNQLAFGDKVEGATASLPVKLAVALLSDRNGVIDLDLPVSGSINDPQFSIGSIIGKVITNVILRAVTAPFSLLTSAFGGGSSEMSSIEFEPGTAALTPAARQTLDKVAKALVERPAVNLTVTGESRLDRERDAWKKDKLQQIVRDERRRRPLGADAPAKAEDVVSAEEYAVLLKSVYKRADIAKPKSLIGVAKDLPDHEMEALLLASIVVGEDAMQQLAMRRGVAVRDYLAEHDIPAARLFLGAPKLANDDTAWTPRADLKLAIN